MAEQGETLVILGATGDLAEGELYPALYELAAAGRPFPSVVAVGRSTTGDDELRRFAEAAVRQARCDTDQDLDTDVLDGVLDSLQYLEGSATEAALFEELAELTQGDRLVVYAGLPPATFAEVARASACLAPRSCLVIEKPFGHDRHSAAELAAEIERVWPAERVLLVDHYVAKAELERLRELRSTSPALGLLWNPAEIAAVRIRLSESFGVEGRGGFFDRAGTVRDVVQNHLLQLLAAVISERPVDESAQERCRARVEALRSIRPIEQSAVTLGQYDGYLDVDGVEASSTTETFARLELGATGPWNGVRFEIATGKCLAADETSVELAYRAGGAEGTDRLRFDLAPDVGWTLRLGASTGRHVDLVGSDDLCALSAYARMFDAARRDDPTMFVSFRDVDESWRIVDEALDVANAPFVYAPGTAIDDVGASA